MGLASARAEAIVTPPHLDAQFFLRQPLICGTVEKLVLRVMRQRSHFRVM
jgi:hypothetical protein